MAPRGDSCLLMNEIEREYTLEMWERVWRILRAIYG